MATKFFVDNLPSEITEERLAEIFTQIGSVESVKLDIDLFSRQSKGSGCVEMSLDLDAYRAINCFNGATFKDRKIQLWEAMSAYERARQMVQHQVSVLARYGSDLKKEFERFH